MRPNTPLPSPTQVGRDIRSLHSTVSLNVKEYFQNIPGRVHLVVDGWTSPLASSILGIVLNWYDKGAMHQAVLEFTRLASSFTPQRFFY